MSPSIRLRHSVSAVSALLWLVLAPPPSHATRVTGHVLPSLAGATRAAPSDASKLLTVTLVLRRDDQAGFEAYLRRVYDPSAADHRRFLSQAELADRFGPSPRAYDEVLTWLAARGFALVHGSANRLTVMATAPRDVVARAFDVDLADYRLGERTFFANDRDPDLPAALAPHVQAVIGLSDLAQPRTKVSSLLQDINNKKTCVTNNPIEFNSTGEQVRNNLLCSLAYVFEALIYNLGCLDLTVVTLSANRFFAPCSNVSPNPYGSAVHPRAPLDPPVDGTGQKIGLLQFDGFHMSDVLDFLTLIGHPENAAHVSEVKVNGGATIGADESEVLLDVSTVLALAPGADVVVYDAPFSGAGTSFQGLFNAMINDGVTVISNSWAYCEDSTTLADVQSIESILQNAAAGGISVFSASGDTGNTCLNGSPHTIAVPAGAPHITAVGGTSVTAGPGSKYVGETWWDGSNDTPPTGQGGFGVSRFFARPSYQNGLTNSPTRSIPDVAAGADPATNGVPLCQASAGGCPGDLLYGGTSKTAPVWAALTALLNDARGSNLGFLNPLLYPLANTNAFHSAASMGSDFAHVGLGSPNVSFLHRALAGETPGAVATALSGVVAYPSDPPADGTTPASVIVQLRDAEGSTVAGKTVTLVANDGSSAVITPASGVTSVANGAVTFSVTNLVAETVTLSATDTTDGLPIPLQATVTFGVPPASAGGIQAFPTTVPANGTSTTTITITLQDTLGRPTPGKLIRLSQGGGHSIISGPNPPKTDAGGQIQFTATDGVSETVTYTAVVETDGDVPVPGNAQVTFDGASTSCVGPPPVGVNGYTVTPFATGFVAENFSYGGVNWGGCGGASAPAFRGADAFVASFRTGGLYRFPPDGGAVSSANIVGTVAPTLGLPVVGKDGKLYATLGSSGAGGATGSVVELDPDTGAVLRTLAAGLKCPAPLAVDPLSGDLFFAGSCFGGGLDDNLVRRIRDPETMTPTVETYAPLAQTPNGWVAFAPDGTLFVETAYTSQAPSVIRIDGTDKPAPPVQTIVNGVTSIFFVTVGSADENGVATSLLGFTTDGLVLYDITASPATSTLIAEHMVAGTIGPDGCLYGGYSDTVYKVTRDDGSCDFAPSSALPALTLTPSTVLPNPAQGTEVELTATFRNLTVPADTPVYFQVTGANTDFGMVRTDADGTAVFRYVGSVTGVDVIRANATIADQVYASNPARITWAGGKHTTFLTLNPSATGGVTGLPAVLAAALIDTSVEPPTPIVGQTITFTRGADGCTATTDASGLAVCVLLTDDAGRSSLTATFAGTPGLLPASRTIGFGVVGGTALSPFTVYQAKPSKGVAKLAKFGPVTLADEIELGGVGYDVQKLESLAAPADLNGAMSQDLVTHLTSYQVKRAKSAPKFAKRTDVRLLNQCSDSLVTLGKPASVLVPTAKDLQNAPTAPNENDHNVDHFVCYKAKQQKKRADGSTAPAFRKGIQVDVEDQFQTTRYDLGKVVLACNPAAKSGTPIVLSGPTKGAPFPITPATLRNPASHLLCYSAKIATKRIEQNGCGPATPGDKGAKIVPPQAKHAPRLGVHLANQFGTPDIDTKKATLVCIPSVLGP